VFKTLLMAALLATCAQADVLYNFAATSTNNNGASGSAAAVAGFIDFYLIGCNTAGTAGCILGIEIQNLKAPATETYSQSITGLTFALSGISTTTFTAGTLTTSGPGGGDISTVSGFGRGGSLAPGSATGWKTEATPNGTFGTGTGLNYGTAGSVGILALEASLDTGTTSHQIVDGLSSLSNAHGTSYAGPVYFQISGIAGLTTSTDITHIAVLFGDGTSTSNKIPDGFLTLPVGDCTALGSGVCSSGDIGRVPEPTTPLLAGSALLALAFVLRRHSTAVTN
jgi:hypothetical protein